MTETGCFYSEYLGRFLSVALSDDVVCQVALGPAISSDARTTAAAVRALESYLRGENVDLGAFQVNIGNRSAFERAVLQSVRGIPKGCTATYSELAARLGKPKAARAVGNALHHNPVPLFVPCHRVVAASGLGGFSWGVDIKRKLLLLEGVCSQSAEDPL
ncbi:MAG TPA: MGMT family protein [Candidatus Bathyarchaeia archaeon]|nr:MGMT family protein [Candidatus Bathyarchaeia archaeon]